MHSVHLLADDGADRTSWLSLWERYGREPFAHPDYAAAFCGPRERACCAVVATPHGEAVIPLILREVDGDVPRRGLRDAASPYGYGGPFGGSAAAVSHAWAALADWMADENVVSMFGRLSLDAPLPASPSPAVTVRSDADNVVVDLTRTADDQWRHYEHKVRKNVNKALRAGLVAQVTERFTDLSEFAALYAATMERRGAAQWYRFDLDFFSRLTERLAGSFVAAEVRDGEGVLVSAELVLVSDRYLYSFLGGTLPSAFPHAPNDLLKHEVINAGRDSGRSGYVLGGGYVPNDGIFRYKRSFDPTGVLPFHRVEVVGDPVAYGALTESRVMSLGAAAAGLSLAEGFFPSYRAPLVKAVPRAES